MDIGGSSKLGLGNNPSDVGDITDGELRRYRYPQISKVLCQQSVNSMKPTTKGEFVDQSTGMGQLASQHM